MTGKVRRIVLLTLGWEELPKSVSVYGAPPEERMREPVPGVLLQTDGGWVLLDTGFNTALVRDPALHRRFFPTVEYRPVLPGPGEPIEQRLAEVGVDYRRDLHRGAKSPAPRPRGRAEALRRQGAGPRTAPRAGVRTVESP